MYGLILYRGFIPQPGGKVPHSSVGNRECRLSFHCERHCLFRSRPASMAFRKSLFRLWSAKERSRGGEGSGSSCHESTGEQSSSPPSPDANVMNTNRRMCKKPSAAGHASSAFPAGSVAPEVSAGQEATMQPLHESHSCSTSLPDKPSDSGEEDSDAEETLVLDGQMHTSCVRRLITTGSFEKRSMPTLRESSELLVSARARTGSGRLSDALLQYDAALLYIPSHACSVCAICVTHDANCALWQSHT